MTIAANTIEPDTLANRKRIRPLDQANGLQVSPTSGMREWSRRLQEILDADPDNDQEPMRAPSVRAAWKILNSLGRLGVDAQRLHLYATHAGNLTLESDRNRIFRSVELLSETEFIVREQDLNQRQSSEWTTRDWQAAISVLAR